MRADLPERPESLLVRRLPSATTLGIGAFFALFAHVGLPLLVMASQWLLVLLGMAIPVSERVRVELPSNLIAAEFVKLGKPFDPTKLPSRKVPPVAKRRPDAVAVSPDARENPEPKDKPKDKPPESQEDLLDNLVDRSREFAEDVDYEQEGDPQGIADGTATEAKAGNIYLGQLNLFFRRNWTVPNMVQRPDQKKAHAMISVDEKGVITEVQIQRSSGDPLFDQSVLDAVQALIAARTAIPPPPPELNNLLDASWAIVFDGKGAH
jgi:TonB family protein